MKRFRFANRLAVFAVLAGCGGCTAGDGESQDDGPGSLLDGGAASIDAAVPLADAGPYDPTTTSLSGTLGATGAIRPIVSSLAISNSGETLIYMTSSPLTCQNLLMSRWLGAFTKDAQVVEIVISGPPKLGPGKSTEVNWATGGRSSAYEQNAKTGSVNFTKAEVNGVVEGTVAATYQNPAGQVMGHFHAEFCPNGQGY